MLSWVLGGVQTPSWPMLGLLCALSAACLGLTLLFARGLDMIGLGEVMATAFGLDVNRFVALAVLAADAFAAAWSPSSALPHPISRAGSSARCTVRGVRAGRRFDRHRRRRDRPVGVIPLGLVTAVAGGPFFVVLLAHRLRA